MAGNHSILWKLFKVLFFIFAIASFRAWFFWWIPGVYTSFLFMLICMTLWIVYPKAFLKKQKNTTWFLTLFVACMLTSVHRNLNGILEIFFSIMPLFFIMSFKDDYKQDFLKTFNVLFGGFLLVSVSYYILFLTGFDLPYNYIQQSSDTRVYGNYYLFVVVDEILPYDRFCSVFLEPGYLGCLLSLLLFSNGFSFRRSSWYNWVYVICLLLTLSLAGWALTIIGLFFLLLKKSKRSNRVWLALGITAVVLGGYLFAVNYNNGDNIVNEAIVMRLEYDEAKESIAGYNRSSEDQDHYFYNNFIKSDAVFFGVDNWADTLDEGVADWKTYVICYGFVGLAAFLLFLFVSVVTEKKGRFMRLCYTALYFLMFVQTMYGVYWLIYISVFVVGLTSISIRNEDNTKALVR